jgi:hypothetical protein
VSAVVDYGLNTILADENNGPIIRVKTEGRIQIGVGDLEFMSKMELRIGSVTAGFSVLPSG